MLVGPDNDDYGRDKLRDRIPEPTCPRCGAEMVVCKRCEGSGAVEDDDREDVGSEYADQHPEFVDCPACNGTGHVCPKCGAEGENDE